MKHLVTREEAALVRAIAADEAAPLYANRIFKPPSPDGSEAIRVVEASGRAACRECGETIEKGEQAIVFGFDTYVAPNLARAYIHAASCRDYPEED